MHLILTHEQADFDAVASLLAAKLLHPEALAVLPRRINRNVRGFLTLYSDHLPFVDFGDLPAGRIERLTLVDTQNSPSLKGATAETEVAVIDHHPPAANLSPAWSVHLGEVGATTTLLIEGLRETGAELDVVEATLMLLGIYEDTGSLTYANTTARDAIAVAWLLQGGASVGIGSDFLNQPLSAKQRELYERLLEAAETHSFHGLSVVIACGDAGGMVEEISSLAHKMRDLFEPAGLFLLVALDENVQLVARSTSDYIDVSRLAEHFGGGGHDRAAAALIQKRDTAAVRSELLGLLEETVVAPKSVGEIMSRGPQLLERRTSIAEAAERMQRFGHEGYPVVEDGRVVGLLTRRAVDRALAHKMGQDAVETVMEAGEVTVLPSDSVQHLQRLMIEHGWGQVPVVDPETGDIVGIVTRTDVLQTLSETVTREPDSLADELEAALPPDRLRLLKLVTARAEERRAALYIVGGFVRDLLLDQPGSDFDLVVEGDAIGLANSLARDFGGSVSSHHRFGTAKWALDQESAELRGALGKGVNGSAALDLPPSLDFVSARTEFYAHPTALPSVERGSIKLDLHRRDFTVNTLALRLDGARYGQVLDFWGGGQDLRSGTIRVLHSLSFVDDATRMLRAVRLEQRLGFSIDPRTLDLLLQAIPLLERVSGDRIRSELELIFQEDNLGRIMARLDDLGLLSAIHPGLTWDPWLEGRFEAARRLDPPAEWKLTPEPSQEQLLYALWVFRLPSNYAAAVCERMQLPGRLTEMILQANRLGRELPAQVGQAAPSQLTLMLENVQEAALAVLWLGLPASGESRSAVDRYLKQWRFIEPSVDGNDLRQRGLPPGPAYSRILAQLRAAWLDGKVSDEKSEARFLEELIEDVTSDGRETERTHS